MKKDNWLIIMWWWLIHVIVHALFVNRRHGYQPVGDLLDDLDPLDDPDDYRTAAREYLSILPFIAVYRLLIADDEIS